MGGGEERPLLRPGMGKERGRKGGGGGRGGASAAGAAAAVGLGGGSGASFDPQRFLAAPGAVAGPPGSPAATSCSSPVSPAASYGGSAPPEEVQRNLKALCKRSSTTRAKALGALAGAFADLAGPGGEAPPAALEACLGPFTAAFRRAALDNSHAVRAQLGGALEALARGLGRRVAPFLRALLPSLWLAANDPNGEVRRAHRRALDAIFGEGAPKRCKALSKLQSAILAQLARDLGSSAAALGDAESESKEELEVRLERVQAASLSALASLVNECTAAEGLASAPGFDADAEDFKRVVVDDRYLPRFLGSRRPPVRREAYLLVGALTHCCPQVLASSGSKLPSHVFKALSDCDPACHPAMWEMLIVYAKHCPDVWGALAPEFVNAFWHILADALAKGCHGSAAGSYRAVLPFLSMVPAPALSEQAMSVVAAGAWEGVRACRDGDRPHAVACLSECSSFFLLNPGRTGLPEGAGRTEELAQIFLLKRALPAATSVDAPDAEFSGGAAVCARAFALVAQAQARGKVGAADVLRYLLTAAGESAARSTVRLLEGGVDCAGGASLEMWLRPAEIPARLAEGGDPGVAEGVCELLVRPSMLALTAVPLGRRSAMGAATALLKFVSTFGARAFSHIGGEPAGSVMRRVVEWCHEQCIGSKDGTLYGQLLAQCLLAESSLPNAEGGGHGAAPASWKMVLDKVDAALTSEELASTLGGSLIVLREVLGLGKPWLRAPELDNIAGSLSTRLSEREESGAIMELVLHNQGGPCALLSNDGLALVHGHITDALSTSFAHKGALGEALGPLEAAVHFLLGPRLPDECTELKTKLLGQLMYIYWRECQRQLPARWSLTCGSGEGGEVSEPRDARLGLEGAEISLLHSLLGPKGHISHMATELDMPKLGTLLQDVKSNLLPQCRDRPEAECAAYNVGLLVGDTLGNLSPTEPHQFGALLDVVLPSMTPAMGASTNISDPEYVTRVNFAVALTHACGLWRLMESRPLLVADILYATEVGALNIKELDLHLCRSTAAALFSPNNALHAVEVLQGLVGRAAALDDALAATYINTLDAVLQHAVSLRKPAVAEVLLELYSVLVASTFAKVAPSAPAESQHCLNVLAASNHHILALAQMSTATEPHVHDISLDLQGMLLDIRPLALLATDAAASHESTLSDLAQMCAAMVTIISKSIPAHTTSLKERRGSLLSLGQHQLQGAARAEAAAATLARFGQASDTNPNTEVQQICGVAEMKICRLCVQYCNADMPEGMWNYCGRLVQKSVFASLKDMETRIEDIICDGYCTTSPFPPDITEAVLCVACAYEGDVGMLGQDTAELTHDIMRIILCSGVIGVLSPVALGLPNAFWEAAVQILPEFEAHTLIESVESIDNWASETEVTSSAALLSLLFSPASSASASRVACFILTLPSVLPEIVPEEYACPEESDLGHMAMSESFTCRAGIPRLLTSRLELSADMSVGARREAIVAWALLLSRLETLPVSSAARRAVFAMLRESGCLAPLLDALVQLLPLGSKKGGSLATATSTPPCMPVGEALWTTGLPRSPWGEETLACSVFSVTLSLLPASVRTWHSDLRNRGVASAVEEYTTSRENQRLVAAQLASLSSLQSVPEGAEGLRVRCSHAAREITAGYRKDDAELQLVVRLPSSYPLRAAEPTVTRRMGVSEARLRKWLLSMSAFLMNQDGSVAEALELWRQNLDKTFEGVDECPICYSVIHPVDRSLPKMACRTCKYKFHSACLYKWFNTSHKSVCPMCKSPF